MPDQTDKSNESDGAGKDRPIRTPRLYWPIITVFGILPNILLLLAALLLVIVSFSRSIQYAAGVAPGEFLLWALILGASAIGNLFVFKSLRRRPRLLLFYTVVVADVGLLLYSVYEWKQSFEIFSSFAPPFETMFLGTISTLSLGSLGWCRFSLRKRNTYTLWQLFGFVTACAVFFAVASWIIRPNRFGNYQDQAAAVEKLEALGGTVRWDDWQVSGILLRGTAVTDDDLRRLSELPQLQSLTLGGTKITDAGMDHLKTLTSLEGLYLDDTKVTDSGLSSITGLTKLKNLWLDNTAVSDGGMVHLKNMTELRSLYLRNTNVTDAGLEHLRHLQQLYYLHLPGTKVTKEGIDRLHEVLPNCRIYGKPNGEPYRVDP